MVLYFTGTGNSRFVAEAIADRLDDQVVDTFEYIRDNKAGTFESEKPWVFVAPIYLSTIAISFVDFIKRSEFKGSNKAYFAATCAGAIGSAPNDCKKLSEEKNFEYKGTARVQMPQNYIALFTMTEPDECERRYNVALEEADKIADVVRNDGHIEEKFASKMEYKCTKFMERWYNKSFTGTKKFFVTDKCIGCGICEKKCPKKNIEMKDGKPVWISNCIHCMACVNGCPKTAVEVGKKTASKQRYMCKKYEPK